MEKNDKNETLSYTDSAKQQKDVIGAVAKGFAESTRNIQGINKENMVAIKADAKANHEAAIEPDPGMIRFMQADGLGNKVKVIAENIKEGARANSDMEKARRAEIQTHGSYKTLLEEQRTIRQSAIEG